MSEILISLTTLCTVGTFIWFAMTLESPEIEAKKREMKQVGFKK